jgi:hypothetical protein
LAFFLGPQGSGYRLGLVRDGIYPIGKR